MVRLWISEVTMVPETRNAIQEQNGQQIEFKSHCFVLGALLVVLIQRYPDTHDVLRQITFLICNALC